MKMDMCAVTELSESDSAMRHQKTCQFCLWVGDGQESLHWGSDFLRMSLSTR